MIVLRGLVVGLASPLAALAVFLPQVALAKPGERYDLGALSIEDLAEVNVSSVSKTAQPLSEAPASIYVISREDIIRSGAVTLPEMLRLAPNLQVYQSTPAQWVVTARGLNGNPAAQSYSNKLLVLIDGRTVYTPLFSGVYWDLPDVLPHNVDRIEVISGPGATLWGSNAVNGVINVITRDSSQVTGLYADLRAGSDRQAVGLRAGGFLGDDLSYEVDGRWLHQDAAFRAAGVSAEDGRERLGGSFRMDWRPGEADHVTVQGELYRGWLEQPGGARDEEVSGRSLVLRWTRQTRGDGEFQAQVFYDRFKRDGGAGIFYADTYDAEFQHSMPVGSAHRLVFGGGARLVDYHIDGSDSLFFEPPGRELFIANAFVQDSWTVTPELVATAGLKAEHLPFSGTSLLPEVRLAWQAAPRTLLWASISRAVRSPTPFDTEVQERAGAISLSGNPEFRTEKLVAYELGTRLQPARSFSLSATAFLHRYDDLRTIELVPGPGLSLGWGNGLEGDIYGVDVWADWRVRNWWTLAAGLTLLETDFRFKPGASGILGTGQLANDPPYYATLRSSMNLGSEVTLDLNFRAVGALRGAAVPAYQELGGRLAWQPTPDITLSVSGTNLLQEHHQEYSAADLIPRRVLAGLELRY